jgi:hypothetical protein
MSRPLRVALDIKKSEKLTFVKGKAKGTDGVHLRDSKAGVAL